ncbi:WIAG-tail domain, partial [Paenibacillus endophyticus]
GSVGEAQLTDGSVTGAKFALGSVGEAQLTDRSVTGAKLAAGSVGSVQLTDGSVTGSKLALGSVGSVQLTDGSVTGSKLAVGSVGEAQLADGSVTGSKLTDESVTGSKLALGSVGSLQLMDGSVTGTKLTAGSVGSAQLIDGSVTGSKLASGSVGTEQIAPGSISADKLAPDLLSSLIPSVVASPPEQIASDSVGAVHIQQQSVELSALRFNPVITGSALGVIKQQFGLAPYSFAVQAEQVELIIPFDEPFADNRYVLTVTTDNPVCYAVVHSKAVDKAAIVIIRTRISHEPRGSINWIAIGKG